MLLGHKRSRRPRKPSRSRSLHCPMPPTPKTHRSLERALPSPERGIARPDAASDAPRNRPPPKRGWTGSRRCGPTATTSRPIANSTPVVGPRVGVPINTCGSGRAARRLRRGNRRHGRRREEPGVIVAELRDQPGQGVVQFDGLVRTGCQQSRGRQEIPVPRRIEGIAFASMRSSSRSSTSRATPLTTRSSTGAGDVTTVKSACRCRQKSRSPRSLDRFGCRRTTGGAARPRAGSRLSWSICGMRTVASSAHRPTRPRRPAAAPYSRCTTTRVTRA